MDNKPYEALRIPSYAYNIDANVAGMIKPTEDKPRNERFWAVCKDQAQMATSRRHPTFKDAYDEAKRLAATERKRFFVLECMGWAEPVDVPAEYHQAPPREDMRNE